MTPIAERALSGHHGVPDWMAVRCAAIMRLMVASSGITKRAGYGMRASVQVFHNRHLLPTDELAPAIMLARVSIRPIEGFQGQIQASTAKSAFMSSAHCVGVLLHIYCR